MKKFLSVLLALSSIIMLIIIYINVSTYRRNLVKSELNLTMLEGDYSVKNLKTIKEVIKKGGSWSDFDEKTQRRIKNYGERDLVEELLRYGHVGHSERQKMSQSTHQELQNRTQRQQQQRPKSTVQFSSDYDVYSYINAHSYTDKRTRITVSFALPIVKLLAPNSMPVDLILERINIQSSTRALVTTKTPYGIQQFVINSATETLVDVNDGSIYTRDF